MGFGFSRGAISKAKVRQDDGQGMGIPCARCGAYGLSIFTEGIDWFAIPRIPIGQGGKVGDNCVIVCPKCFKEIGQDGTKEIPFSELPYFVGKRRR